MTTHAADEEGRPVLDQNWARDVFGGDPLPGTLWWHYKGGVYSVIYRAVNEADLVPVVAYVSVKTGYAWVRPVAEFRDEVTLPDGSTVRRFTELNQPHEE